MSNQYAGTPTGTGPALPTYLSDADIQAARVRALCDVDSMADCQIPQIGALICSAPHGAARSSLAGLQ